MQLIDANVLLYAVNRDSPQHRQARAWLDAAINGSETVGMTWTVLLAFMRLATHSAVFASPLTVEQAVGAVREWLAHPSVTVVEPTSRHLDVLGGLLADTGSAGNLVNDAHLAALAIEHAAAITSFDADFGRFKGVRWHSPSL